MNDMRLVSVTMEYNANFRCGIIAEVRNHSKVVFELLRDLTRKIRADRVLLGAQQKDRMK